METKILENVQDEAWGVEAEKLHKEMEDVVGQLHFHTENDRCVVIQLEVSEAPVAH